MKLADVNERSQESETKNCQMEPSSLPIIQRTHTKSVIVHEQPHNSR